VGPVGAGRRGHWPLLVTGPLAGVADRLLVSCMRDGVETWNDNPRPFTWPKSAEETLDRLAGSCRTLNN
jgi:hypothetical protein